MQGVLLVVKNYPSVKIDFVLSLLSQKYNTLNCNDV